MRAAFSCARVQRSRAAVRAAHRTNRHKQAAGFLDVQQKRRHASITRALSSVAVVADAGGGLQSTAILAAGSVVGVGLFWAALKIVCGYQVTYVTGAMLSRQLPKEQLRVVQVGGSVKDLYYYPSTTVQVTVLDKESAARVWEMGGVQARVPVVHKEQNVGGLRGLPPSSADAVVCLAALSAADSVSALFDAVLRVLKPGGRFIFVEPIKSGGSPSFSQQLVGTATQAVEFAQFESLKRKADFQSVAWDVANESIDPHIVGIAQKRT